MLIKILGPDRESIHGGTAKWVPKRWQPEIKNVKLCITGYHLIEPWAFASWWRENCTVWEAEGRGTHEDEGTKSVWAQARIVRCLHTPTLPDLVHYATDSARRVLAVYEDYSADDRPRKAIEAADTWVAHPTKENAYAAARAANAAACAAANAARAPNAANAAATYAAYAAANAGRVAADPAYVGGKSVGVGAAAAATYAAYAAANAAYAANAANALRAEQAWQSERMLDILLQRTAP